MDCPGAGDMDVTSADVVSLFSSLTRTTSAAVRAALVSDRGMAERESSLPPYVRNSRFDAARFRGSVPTGRSGLEVTCHMPDCGVRGPRFESHRGQLCLSRQPLRYTALSTGCTPILQFLGRLSPPPSVGR